MASDALAPCVTRSSASTKLIDMWICPQLTPVSFVQRWKQDDKECCWIFPCIDYVWKNESCIPVTSQALGESPPRWKAAYDWSNPIGHAPTDFISWKENDTGISFTETRWWDCLILVHNGNPYTGKMAPFYWIRPQVEGILPKGPYLPCVSMAGRALLAGYHRSGLYWCN